MKKQRVLIFIVSYNHQLTITSVLNRLPDALFNDERYETETLIIDDCSPDKTFQTGFEFIKSYEKCPVTILKNPDNLGYGGNQKVGYQYAIEKGYDHVVLLHGDGQYAPEVLPELLEPLIASEADAVYGSRMLKPEDALKGGMPRYKFYGNQVLTRLENYLAKAELSEWHSGLRLYSVNALKDLPFKHNSDYYDFDTDIILQFVGAGKTIKEIPIPTHYGDEECNVDGLKYARKIIASCLLYRVQRWGVFYHPKFDFTPRNERYQLKHSFTSSHQKALEHAKSAARVLVLGAEVPGFMEALQAQGCEAVYLHPRADEHAIEKLLDEEAPFSAVLSLEALEHSSSAEDLLVLLRAHASTRDAQFFFSAGNVGFLPIRIMLLLGGFNYGVRGILDKSHRRLFTLSSFRSLLSRHGFELGKTVGIPAPYPLAFGNTGLARFLLNTNSLLISLISRRLFGYQVALTAHAKPTTNVLLERAYTNTEAEIEKLEPVTEDDDTALEPETVVH